MPSRYRRDADRLKAEIVARVGAGETVLAVCVAAHMPTKDSVRNWALADAAFAEALAAARRRARAFDAVKAEAFLARAWAGEAINSLIGRPGMPLRAQYRRWNATEPAFAAAVAELRQRRDARLGERGRARRLAFDQEKADRIIVRLNAGFHTGVGLQALLAADPELPCWVTLKRWRREQPLFDKVLRGMISARQPAAMKPVPEFMVQEIVEHIVEGGSFASLSRMPGWPTQGTLRRWLRDPNFASQVARACVWREDWYREQIADIARRTPPGSLREAKRAVGPLLRQLVRLRHRPGAVHRRAATPRKGERTSSG